MSFSADGDDAVEFKRAASELVASEVPKHTGPISLTDTPLEPSVSRTRPTISGENPEMESLLQRRRSSCLPVQVLWIETNSFLPHGAATTARPGDRSSVPHPLGADWCSIPNPQLKLQLGKQALEPTRMATGFHAHPYWHAVSFSIAVKPLGFFLVWRG